MTRLASRRVNLKPSYTIVVIGSGYGGSILASRMARAGQQVCLLERGKEFQPGEFPESESQVFAETQVTSDSGHLGWRHGLYDFRLNNEVDVVVGCGLGGGSLINANVAMRPDPRVFDDPIWPHALRDDINTMLKQGFERAEEMLKPSPYPSTFPPLLKRNALTTSAEALNQPVYSVPINVNFTINGINSVGVEQHPCKMCGDCISGCNHRSKNTLAMNYLPDAKNFGVDIFTQVEVRYLERENNQWVVHYQILESGQESFDAPLMFTRA